ncbi:MAG: hypothetical protein KA153_09110 [Hyphomonadaceae bacterium]|nr:hypothetical protein [Hyphomonadaceae bacterium]
MTSRETILDMNITRYRELIRTEKDAQFRANLEEALDRDLRTKSELVASAVPQGAVVATDTNDL